MEATVRDSAGIRIIESSFPAWAEGQEWTVSADPLLRIGTTEGEEEDQLFRVRDVTRLADGRIAVVNSGSHELRLYSGAGRYLQSIGGRGGGPGEFQGPSRVWRLDGDSLLVMDRTRLSRFDAAGAFAGSGPVPRPVPIERFPDGTWLSAPFVSGTEVRDGGYVRPDLVMLRIQPHGNGRDTLGIVTGDERYHVSWTDGIAAFPAPFGAQRAFAVSGDSLYTGEGSVFELRLLDGEGRTLRIQRRPDYDRTLTQDDIRRYEAILQGIYPPGQVRERVRELLGTWTYPTRHPAWYGITVDASGSVWVRHYTLADDIPATWSVFNPEGGWLGELRVPGRFQVREIGLDYILGISTDELGIEYVDMYGLSRY